jgi:hypothetical protein
MNNEKGSGGLLLAAAALWLLWRKRKARIAAKRGDGTQASARFRALRNPFGQPPTAKPPKAPKRPSVPSGGSGIATVLGTALYIPAPAMMDSFADQDAETVTVTESNPAFLPNGYATTTVLDSNGDPLPDQGSASGGTASGAYGMSTGYSAPADPTDNPGAVGPDYSNTSDPYGEYPEMTQPGMVDDGRDYMTQEEFDNIYN